MLHKACCETSLIYLHFLYRQLTNTGLQRGLHFFGEEKAIQKFIDPQKKSKQFRVECMYLLNVRSNSKFWFEFLFEFPPLFHLTYIVHSSCIVINEDGDAVTSSINLAFPKVFFKTKKTKA